MRLIAKPNIDESCRGSEVSSTVDSDQVFSQIKSWCSDCISKHSRCSIAKSPVSWLPSRVIDLGIGTAPSAPRIIESSGAAGKYATLTHRWTKLTEISATTQANYEARKIYIDTILLSQVFQDAFQATKKLGVRYLWIDALCIIQDSPQDWKREAKNMRSIYEFAWLNIAVAGSEQEDGRIFMKRSPRLSRPCRLPVALLPEYALITGGLIYAFLDSQFYSQSVFNGFLTRRGWILQERILSPRTVYFGQEEVFWECGSTIASETLPWGWKDESKLVKFNSHDLGLHKNGLLESGQDFQHNLNEPRKKVENSSGDLKVGGKSLAPLYIYWYHLVEAYSQKGLTNSQDRLPAILGLAQAIHKSGIPYQTFQDCYRHGIWLSKPSSLLWYLSSSPKVPISSRAGTPSYSWGSWNTPSKYLHDSIHFRDETHVQVSATTLAGYYQGQAVILSPPDEMTMHIHVKRRDAPLLVQAKGQLQIANMSTYERGYHYIDSSIEHFAPSSRLHCDIRYRHMNGRTPRVIIDEFPPDQDFKNWFRESSGIVWLLKIAVGSLIVKSEINAPWLAHLGEEYGFDRLQLSDTQDQYFDFGLVLIPTKEDLEALKEVQEKLDTLNSTILLPAFNGDRGTSSCSSPKVELDMSQWREAKGRLEAYTLLGPHNTTFRRIGIYHSRASDPTAYKDNLTTVLLA